MKWDRRMLGGIRNIAPTAGFFLYALLAAPPLARALKAALADPQPVWGPGLVLLAVLLLEPLGLRWKILFLRRRAADAGFEPQGSMLAVFSAAGIAHMLVTMFLGMAMLDCWGAVGVGSEDAANAWGVVIVALILKEFAELFAGAGSSMAREPPGHWKEWAAEILLLGYGCVAYTAWWEAIVDLEAFSGASWVEKAILLPVLAGLFALIYLPLRIDVVLEEHFLRPRRGRRWRLGAELALGTFLGLYPVLF